MAAVGVRRLVLRLALVVALLVTLLGFFRPPFQLVVTENDQPGQISDVGRHWLWKRPRLEQIDSRWQASPSSRPAIRLGKQAREPNPTPLPLLRVNKGRVWGEMVVAWLTYGILLLALRQKLCSRCGSPRVRSYCGRCGWQQGFAPDAPAA